jgi:predicted transcriptional regulator
MAKVTPEMCAELRAKARVKQTSDIDIKNVNLSLSVMQYHVYGHCTHEIDEKPKKSKTNVDAKECKKMREIYKNGKSYLHTGFKLNRSGPTVRRHVKGECKHDVNEDISRDTGPYTHSDRNPSCLSRSFTRQECTEIRELFKQYRNLSFVADKLDISEQGVRIHVDGDCKHDVDSIHRKTYSKVSEEECKNIRQIYKNSNSLDKAVGKTERALPTVKRHVKGECRHSVSEDVLVNIDESSLKHSVSKKECHSIRKLYKEHQNSSKVESMVGRSTSTVLRHARAHCEHGVVENIVENVGNNKGISGKISSSDCIKMRELALDMTPTGEIAEKLSCSTQTVYRHIRNDCSHNTHGIHERIAVRPVDERMCSALRYLYYEESMTANDITELDNIGLLEEDVKTHVSNNCKHDIE